MCCAEKIKSFSNYNLNIIYQSAIKKDYSKEKDFEDGTTFKEWQVMLDDEMDLRGLK